uniref:G protein-coupled receptor n=1 Tax=Pristionchus pacificus TaxID=54126 RepID=A0A8R1YXG4_PRIPA
MLDSDYAEKAQCVAGVVTNSVLLYCIRCHTRTPLGAYKHLLTIFAVVDLFLCILHAFVEPKVIIVDHIFAVISGVFDDQRAMSIYASCFAVPFTLMNIHFLYRYWRIQKPHLIELFSKASFIFFLACIPITEMSVWYLLCIFFMTGDGRKEAIGLVRAEFEKKHGRSIGEGWILMDHWVPNNHYEKGRNDRNGYEDPWYALTLLLFDTVMLISILLATTLGVLTFNGIRSQIKLSSIKRNFELKLLFAATAQVQFFSKTLVPFVFVYIPYVCCLNLPFFSLPVVPIPDLTFLFISCFPLWDAVIVLLLIRDYRRALWEIGGGMIGRLRLTRSTSVNPTPESIATMTIINHA